MAGKHLGWLAVGALCGWLAAPAPAGAEPGPWKHNQGSYSRLNYWLPSIYRLRACLHPPTSYTYPPGYVVYPKGTPVPHPPSPYFEPHLLYPPPEPAEQPKQPEQPSPGTDATPRPRDP